MSHPSEKSWSSSVGMMKFPTEWKVIIQPCSSHHQPVQYIWRFPESWRYPKLARWFISWKIQPENQSHFSPTRPSLSRCSFHPGTKWLHLKALPRNERRMGRMGQQWEVSIGLSWMIFMGFSVWILMALNGIFIGIFIGISWMILGSWWILWDLHPQPGFIHLLEPRYHSCISSIWQRPPGASEYLKGLKATSCAQKLFVSFGSSWIFVETLSCRPFYSYLKKENSIGQSKQLQSKTQPFDTEVCANPTFPHWAKDTAGSRHQNGLDAPSEAI